MNALIAFAIAVGILCATAIFIFVGAVIIGLRLDRENERASISRQQWLKEEYPDIFGNTPDR